MPSTLRLATFLSEFHPTNHHHNRLGLAGAFLMPTLIATSLYMLTSWYGPGFHGRLTANGEIYNQYAMTAAHKTLPFGTRLRVCLNGCVVVRVNDRGPYIGSRELDLSYGAAKAIGLLAGGVTTVKVDHV